MKKSCYLNISEIASYIGYNVYDPVKPFERFWKRYDAVTYNNLLNKMNKDLLDTKVKLQDITESKEILEIKLLKKEITKRQYNMSVKEIINKEQIEKETMENTINKINSVSLSISEQIENTLGKNTIDKINDSSVETDTKREQIKNIIDLRDDLTEYNKSVLMNQTTQFINTTHGILKEDPVIEKFEEKFKVKLDVSQKYNKKYFIDTLDNIYYIGGKVDGLYINSDPKKSYVVEVKNRTKGFFNSLRDYEKLQIQLYMWILDLDQAKLVESYKENMRITIVYKDQEFIDNSLEYLKIFINNFEHGFLNKNIVKEKYMNSNEIDKKKFLNKLYLTEIEKAKNDLYEKKLIETDEICLIDDLD